MTKKKKHTVLFIGEPIIDEQITKIGWVGTKGNGKSTLKGLLEKEQKKEVKQ